MTAPTTAESPADARAGGGIQATAEPRIGSTVRARLVELVGGHGVRQASATMHRALDELELSRKKIPALQEALVAANAHARVETARADAADARAEAAERNAADKQAQTEALVAALRKCAYVFSGLETHVRTLDVKLGYGIVLQALAAHDVRTADPDSPGTTRDGDRDATRPAGDGGNITMEGAS